jgi:hypothetical protein
MGRGVGGWQRYVVRMERYEICITFLSESLNRRVHLGNKSIDGRMLLKLTLKQQLLRLKTSLHVNLLQIGFSASPL